MRWVGAAVALAITASACGNGTSEDRTSGSSTTTAVSREPATTDPPATTSTATPTTAAPTTTTTTWGVQNGTLVGPAGLLVPLDGCGAGWSDAAAPEGTTLVLGQTAPLTGPLAAALAPILAGFDARIARANATAGVGGRPLEVRREDDAYQSGLTPEAARRLVDGGAFALVGGIGSGQAIAAAPDANARCIPQLFPYGGHPGLSDPGGAPWTVGHTLAVTVEAWLWAKHIAATNPGGATVAMVTIDNDYGVAFEDALAAATTAYPGIALLGPFRHAQNGSDAAARTAEALASGATVLVAGTAGPGCTGVVSAAAAAPVTRYLAIGCAVNAVVGTGAADGWLQLAGTRDVTDPAVLADPALAEYRADAAAAGLDPASAAAWTGWISADIIVETLRAAAARPGGLTRTNVLLAARSLDLAHPSLPSGARLRLNGAADAHATESATLFRYQGTGRVAVTVLDNEGRTPPCAFDRATLRCR